MNKLLLFDDLVSMQSSGVAEFDYFGIKIASDNKILSWSYGEVKRPDTINYRTLRPEKDGLFCCKIFGTVKDYECLCGKYKRYKYKGIKCEKCDVEVTLASVRRDRIGHVKLASPVVNPLFLKSGNGQSIVGSLLKKTVSQVESLARMVAVMVTDPGATPLKKHEILMPEEFEEMSEKYGFDSFKIQTGPEAIKTALIEMDFYTELENLKIALKNTKAILTRKQILTRKRLITNLLASGNKPEWIVMTVVPVLPPDLRPVVMLDGNKYASSDLNDLYRILISRNNRLKKLISLGAPDVIVRHEKRLLQEIVDALFNNSKLDKPLKDQVGRPLRCISDSLKGKGGRFRQNLLGKRVDYSGRSVIVSGPSLKLHQCGLPKLMAVELLKPFLIGRLCVTGKASTISSANELIESNAPIIWDMLEDVIKEHPILLNRAPTLHRLGIQAFEPKLINSKAIQLHPLVCKSFNADFDGDQMAVHIPLSIESQIEARVLIMSSNNILNPANGDPMIVPKKDMAVGLYYLSFKNQEFKGKVRSYIQYEDVSADLHNKKLLLHDEIKYYYNFKNQEHSIITTPGRVKLFEIVPHEDKIDLADLNEPFSVKMIEKVVKLVYKNFGQKAAVILCDKLMYIGFEYSTISGLSFGQDDMVIPTTKPLKVQEALDFIKQTEDQYQMGYITSKEKFNKITDRWAICTSQISKDMMSIINKDNKNPYTMNSINMIMHSGARASETQMRQLAGMRGLISKTSGEILETPIISNFKEGLELFEYFNSAHGSRKGSVDTALKTADAGYLTRRLVDVAQDCVVTEEDCGTQNGLVLKAKLENGRVVKPVTANAIGRILAKDIEFNGNVIKSGSLLTDAHIDILDKLHQVEIFSPVFCKTKDGICSKCYGIDMSTQKPVSVGEAAGIIAAQSMGEPGTQLTMNTFHVGGATSKAFLDDELKASCSGKVRFVNIDKVNAKDGVKVISHFGTIEVCDENQKILEIYDIKYGCTLLVNDGDSVKADDILIKWDPYVNFIYADTDAYIKYEDLEIGISINEKFDDVLCDTIKIVSEWQKTKKDLTPRVKLVDKNGQPVLGSSGYEIFYNLTPGCMLLVNDGAKVKMGDEMVKFYRENDSSGASDITGGLPMVENIFEARHVTNPAILSPFDGHVEFMNDYKTKNKIVIHPIDKSLDSISFVVQKNRKIQIKNGSFVKKGSILLDGDLDIHSVLKASGINDVILFITERIQSIYGLQGVFINSKHIEIVAKFMLQKSVVKNPVDTELSVDEVIYTYKLEEINKQREKEGFELVKYEPIVQSITKASLDTESFISAASFQETIRILTNAAIAGSKDPLKGMKENVILGRLIPAGTGVVINKLRKQS